MSPNVKLQHISCICIDQVLIKQMNKHLECMILESADSITAHKEHTKMQLNYNLRAYITKWNIFHQNFTWKGAQNPHTPTNLMKHAKICNTEKLYPFKYHTTIPPLGNLSQTWREKERERQREKWGLDLLLWNGHEIHGCAEREARDGGGHGGAKGEGSAERGGEEKGRETSELGRSSP